MTDRTEIREKILKTLITVQPNLADATIEEHTSLSDLRVDSLHLIEVGVLLEDTFGSAVRFDEWLERERAKTDNAYALSSLVDYVSEACHS
ncbi:MAG TPA: hypothetical protein DDZ76_11550 [Xanthomonadales bacterium]|nr:hypothetical protein [Xanthomonadales bacterium]